MEGWRVGGPIRSALIAGAGRVTAVPHSEGGGGGGGGEEVAPTERLVEFFLLGKFSCFSFGLFLCGRILGIGREHPTVAPSDAASGRWGSYRR